jgi:hypothetical protein
VDKLDVSSKVFGILGEIAKIVAIILGGAWVLFNFVFVDGPGRTAALSPSVDLKILATADSSLCELKLSTALSNGSKQTVGVSAVSIGLWFFTPRPSGTEIEVLDWKKVESQPPAWVLPVEQSDYLTATYEPGQGASYSYTLFVPKSEERLIHVKMTLSSPDSGIQDEVSATRTVGFDC